MLYLALSITGMTCLALIVRLGADRGASAIGLNMAFRVSGGCVMLALCIPAIDWSRFPTLLEQTGLLVALSALGFWGSGFAAINAVRYGHLGLTWTVLRCAMLVPALTALVLWQEVPLSPVSGLLVRRVMGIVLATAAVLLSGYDRAHQAGKQEAPEPSRQATGRWLFWAATAFVAQGTWETCAAASRYLPDEQARRFFVVGTFVLAGLLALAYAGCTRTRLRRIDISLGVLAGACSLLGSGARVWAARDLGGLVVFPVTAVTVLLLVQVASFGLWHERMGRWGYGGCACAVTGVLLLSV